MVPVSPVDAEQIGRLRVAVVRLSRELRATRSDAGLTPSQAAVLGSLVRSGEVRLSALAAAERINPTLLSRVVGHLEQHGYARRSTDPADRRAATVAATAQGRRTMQRLGARMSELLAVRIARLPTDQQALLLAALPALEILAQHEDPE